MRYAQRRGWDADKAVEVLGNAPLLTSAQIYYGGEISEYALALTFLWRSGEDSQYWLFYDAKTLAGRLYALTLIYEFNPRAYHRMKSEIDPKGVVWYQSGCVLSKVGVPEVFKMIEEAWFFDTAILKNQKDIGTRKIVSTAQICASFYSSTNQNKKVAVPSDGE